jgi:hypothetical protein
MIEYTVVCVFGILFVTQGPMSTVVTNVTTAMQNNYNGYSYAVSISDYPDMNATVTDNVTYQNFLIAQGVPANEAARLGNDPNLYLAELMGYNLPNPPSLSGITNNFSNLPPSVNQIMGGVTSFTPGNVISSLISIP